MRGVVIAQDAAEGGRERMFEGADAQVERLSFAGQVVELAGFDGLANLPLDDAFPLHTIQRSAPAGNGDTLGYG